jgi:hypothetical protein
MTAERLFEFRRQQRAGACVRQEQFAEEAGRRTAAEGVKLMEEDRLRVSTQVLQELFVTLTRKVSQRCLIEEALFGTGRSDGLARDGGRLCRDSGGRRIG